MSISRSFSSVILGLFLLVPASLHAADHVWIEGENPTRTNVEFNPVGWGPKGYLSGGKWLFDDVEVEAVEKKIPADGANLEYDFTSRTAGDYQVWLRIGYKFARTPFRWRIDEGPWGTVKPTDPTTDLMALGDWSEVSWLRAGHAKLDTGRHTLTINIPRPFKDPIHKTGPQRVLFGFDCCCLSKTPFRPNGPHQPGSDWKSDLDRAAEKQTFVVKFPAVETKSAERVVVPLNGTWQIGRFDEQEIVDRTAPVRKLPEARDQFPWKGIHVPGNRDTERPDLLYAHRFIYRTRLQIPEKADGRTFLLHFPSTVLIASVLVNGKYQGYSKDPCAAWDCDITPAIKSGAVNELCVVIKDLYYAQSQAGDGRSIRTMFNVPPSTLYTAGGLSFARFADFPVVFDVRQVGILETPSLVVTSGTVYVSDVFAKPSVTRKRLDLEVSLTNPTDNPVTVKVDHQVTLLTEDKPILTIPDTEVEVPARGEKTIQVGRDWADPKLWWPDDPVQHRVVTQLKVGDKVVDVQRIKFGFREWGWKGKAFTLNGIPWHLRADLMYNDAPPGDPRKAVKDWRKAGLNTVRLWGPHPWTGASREEALDFMDAQGVIVRRSGIFDGQLDSYLLVENKGGKIVARKDLFDNWIHRLRAWVKAQRNHPSILIWSLENEITSSNARDLGWLDQVEPEIKRAAREIMELDPTRPVMIDGGNALRDRSLPVYGNHYNEFPLREYPDEAYTLKLARKRSAMPGRDPWPIGDDKPLFLGESLFVPGYRPSDFSQLSGAAAFLGWSEARQGVEIFARMLSEGYRWNGVAAFHFWLGPDRGERYHTSWAPVCALVREWNWTFGSGQKVERTIKIFNDTRSADPIQFSYEVKVGGEQIVSHKHEYHIPPGETVMFGEQGLRVAPTFVAPRVKERTRGEFILTCSRNGTEVFRDVKPIWIIPEEAGPKPALEARELVVFDPKGMIRDRLRKRGIGFTTVETFDRLPLRAKVLVVGPDALTPRQATDPKWQAIAASGTRVLVLDQTNPLHYQALPADLATTSYSGRVAFVENLEHPAFAGLMQEDFFCWSGDHIVYRNAYRKSARGARSLVQCDENLSCTALAECPVREGLLVLCQLPVGTKLATDAVARRLFDNLLDYCSTWQPAARKTVVVMGKDDLRTRLLNAGGLKYEQTDDLLAALRKPDTEIVVADASPANLKELTADSSKDVVKSFTARGGWLMLWGLTPEGLSDFNKVVGQSHVIRPFRMERVSMPAKRDPILAGLTRRDVVLESTRRIFPWSDDLYPANDTFTHIVDLDDIAPFCTCPTQPFGWRQMTNGLLSADASVFIFAHKLKDDPKPRWTAHLPKEEEITEFSIVPNTSYYQLPKLRLIFDGKESDAVTLNLKPTMTKQTFAITPARKAQTITLQPLEWKEVGKQPVIGIENLWIRVKRPESYQKSVIPLLNIGGLVKYRLGKGGVVLNQVKGQEKGANPVNREKKQTLVSTLLRNLGAPFVGGRVLIAGANLKYQPIPLAEKCNQYVTVDKGWLAGKRDLALFPSGENRFTEVTYQVRDFRTSPLRACIMLAGPGAKGDLPKEVKNIPVDRKADVLFFLHTLHPAREWKAHSSKDLPPVVVRYVVRYEDGKSEEIPIRLGQDVSGWIQERPVGLPGAAVAWVGQWPDSPDGPYPVVYQKAWTNPRPGIGIKSLEMRYDDKEGNTWGVPVLLGVTAATEE